MSKITAPIWDLGFERLPSLSSEVEADVVVIGLGGSGLNAVLGLLGAGLNVIGIDATTIAGQAAGRNGGFILAGLADFYHDACERFGHERAKAIYALTCEQIESMASAAPHNVKIIGSLRIADSEEEFRDCSLQYDALRRDGFDVEMYEGKEGKGLLIPGDGVYNPMVQCHHLAQTAIERSAQLFEFSEAVEIAGSEIRTTHGKIRCQKVVVAVDGNLEKVLPELAGEVRTARLQMLATAPTSEVSFARPIYRRWGYDYWQQLPNGVVALGGYRDADFDAEWTGSNKPSKSIQNLLENYLREFLCVDAPVTHSWAGNVSFNPTGLPLMRMVRPNVWAIGAYCGTGNVLGALCGQEIARKVATGKSVLFDLINQ